MAQKSHYEKSIERTRKNAYGIIGNTFSGRYKEDQLPSLKNILTGKVEMIEHSTLIMKSMKTILLSNLQRLLFK